MWDKKRQQYSNVHSARTIFSISSVLYRFDISLWILFIKTRMKAHRSDECLQKNNDPLSGACFCSTCMKFVIPKVWSFFNIYMQSLLRKNRVQCARSARGRVGRNPSVKTECYLVANDEHWNVIFQVLVTLSRIKLADKARKLLNYCHYTSVQRRTQMHYFSLSLMSRANSSFYTLSIVLQSSFCRWQIKKNHAILKGTMSWCFG